MKLNSLTVRLLAALILGLALGAALPGLHLAGQARAITYASALGGVWLDGVRMTIVPLVFSLLVVGVGQLAGSARAGGFTVRVLVMFGGLLLVSAVMSITATSALLHVWPSPESAAAALRAGAQGAAKAIPPSPPVAEWLQSFVPANVVKAAVNGDMLSIVVFGLLFGMAATQLPASRRESLFGFFDAVQATMMTIVGWVLWLGPVGVFFLAFEVGAKTGFGAVGVLGHYVIVVSIMCLAAGVLGLVAGILGGGAPAGAFGKAMIQPTALAISTQSSLACLPLMLKAADEIDVPDTVRDLVLPLAVALFRITNTAANLAVAVYIAHIYGIPLDPARVATAIVVATIVSVAAVGVASSVTFFASLVPICMTLGVPIDLLPLLIAVETFPDFSRTIGNVWGDLGVTAWAARRAQSEALVRI